MPRIPGGSTSAVPSGQHGGDTPGQLASVLEASFDAIYTEDPAGSILTWNKGAERLYGFSAADVLGRRSDILFPVALRGEARDLLARVLTGESLEQLETEVRRHDGMVVSVWLSLSPVWEAGGVISGAAAVARDVTEQKLALATLAESEAQLQEAQALAHVGIWVWDSVAGTVQWSDELYRIHDVDPMDFDGTVESYLALIAPEDRERVGQETRDAVQSAKMLETEYQIVRPSGERRWAYLRGEPVAAALSTVGLRGICHDMTERVPTQG